MQDNFTQSCQIVSTDALGVLHVVCEFTSCIYARGMKNIIYIKRGALKKVIEPIAEAGSL